LQAAGVALGAAAIPPTIGASSEVKSPAQPREKKPTRVAAAFVYTPSAQLKEEGYWSWPGSSFNPEEQQKVFSARLAEVARRLDVQVDVEAEPLAEDQAVARFIGQVKKDPPDGLLIFVFKKYLCGLAERILSETKLPTVASVPLGTLLNQTILAWKKRSGAYLIDAERDDEALADSLQMFCAARWMKDSRLINVAGSESKETVVPCLGVQVKTIPNADFFRAFKAVETTAEVRQLAQAYRAQAREIVEPTPDDMLEAARCYYALKSVLWAECGDALMMDCLPGLAHPRQHVPPCMAFMSLHDEGIVAGCQADLDPALTMMLGTRLLGKSGFMHNGSWNIAENLYFGAHCTCPRKMNGPDAPELPYIIRSHNEAGWGCVPQVLFPDDQPATLVRYCSDRSPRMFVLPGKITCCYPKLSGGCRTNFSMRIDGVDYLEQAKLLSTYGHFVLFFGDHGKQLETFCKLHGIEVIDA